jgi:hypothetical protein
MTSGVPVGRQVAMLSISTSGWPFEVTRTAAVVHCAVAQGGAPELIAGNVQPTIAYGTVARTVGMPLTSTRGFGVVGVAMPA